MIELTEILCRIQTIAPFISSDPLSGARHLPKSSAAPTECFSNASRKARQNGGSELYGWMFHVRGLATSRGRHYLIAVNHAVWHAPDKSLIDVTPFHSDPKHRPIVVNGDVVVFLVDRRSAPLKRSTSG